MRRGLSKNELSIWGVNVNFPVAVRRLGRAALLGLALTLPLTSLPAWSEQTWTVNFKDAELEELARALPKRKESYVFFNNYKMTEDALRFCKLLSDES